MGKFSKSTQPKLSKAETSGKVSGDSEILSLSAETVRNGAQRSIPIVGIGTSAGDLEAAVPANQEPAQVLGGSEGRYRTLFEQAAVGMALIETKTGLFININQKYCDFLGFTKEELLNLTFQAVTYPDDMQENVDKMELLRTGKTREYSIEKRYIRKDGSIVWGNLTASPLWSPGEVPADQFHIAVVQDITESKQAEKALQESEKRFRTLFEQAAVGVALFETKTGRYIDINQKLCNFLGYTKAEMLNLTFQAVTYPDDLQENVDHNALLMARKIREFSIEKRYIRKDGSTVWGNLTVSPLWWVPDDEPTDHYHIAVVQDITERKQMEEEKQHLYEQLVQAQKMESVGRLAGGVAHDFNNLLGVIIGRAETALEKVTPDKAVYQDLQEILEAGGRSADLTRQLLAFARKQPANPILLDLNKTVSSIFEILRRLIGENNDLVWIPCPDLWVVRADSSQIDQILTNLVVNARDAIIEMGKVVIETSNIICDNATCAKNPGLVPGEYVLLAVSDNGTGMDQDILSHLFEPFFTTKEIGKGTGLGLSTVYGVVKQNNGYIKVSSEPGRGTSFQVYLPRVETDVAPIPIIKAVETAQGAAELILIVEDEDALLELGKETLETIGYRVLAASTPDEALRLAQEHGEEIHLLITDVIMPGMNGKVLAELLRANLPGLKCLFMSGYTANIITERGVLAKGIYFIQKPFSLGDLASKVREVLGRK